MFHVTLVDRRTTETFTETVNATNVTLDETWVRFATPSGLVIAAYRAEFVQSVTRPAKSEMEKAA